MATKDYRVTVRNSNDEIVARVHYNDCLDYWDGHNNTSGSPGRHIGITRLADGQYVLIHGTQWQGEHDTAEIVTENEALQEILRTGNGDMLNKPKWADLKIFMEKTIKVEME